MQVVLVAVGRVVVDHRRHVVDVDATSRDVRRDQRFDRSPGEVSECPVPLVLRPAPVHRYRGDTLLVELPCEPVRSMARAGEHDRGTTGPDRLRGVVDLLGPFDIPEEVGRLGGVRLDTPRLVAHGIGLIRPHQHGDIPVEGGGEEQRLAVRCRGVEDPPDSREEAHVRHAVRLVHGDDADR